MPCKHCHKSKVKAIVFKQGHFYKIWNEIYICARINSHEDSKKGWWALISLSTGNRFRDPVDDINNVGGNEFEEVDCAISEI